MRFTEGDRVRVDIPDQSDPDFHRHRETGSVVDIVEDDVDKVTDDDRDGVLYFVDLDDSEAELYLRWRDLRPVKK